VISISPLVEHDAIYMKIRLERLLDDLEREGSFKEVAKQVTGA
jgi:hypothetical protein